MSECISVKSYNLGTLNIVLVILNWGQGLNKWEKLE